MRYIVNILILLLISVGASSQSDRMHIRSGNRDMRGGAEGAAAKAETKYRKALGYSGAIERMERFAFYERAKKAYAVIQTGEERQYGNLILV